MKPLIAVLYAAPHDERSRLVTLILKNRGIPYKLYTDSTWHGHADKIKTVLRAAQELIDYEYLLFLDAYDVIALAGPDEILERFNTFDHPWVCAAELNLWPPGSLQPEEYEKVFDLVSNTSNGCHKIKMPWRYLNSGIFLAKRDYLRSCLEQWTLPEQIWSDQYWFAKQYLAHPGAIHLDTRCQLFQCLISGWWAFEIFPGKLYNNYTKTFPLLLHRNGGGKLTTERIRPLWEGI